MHDSQVTDKPPTFLQLSNFRKTTSLFVQSWTTTMRIQSAFKLKNIVLSDYTDPNQLPNDPWCALLRLRALLHVRDRRRVNGAKRRSLSFSHVDLVDPLRGAEDPDGSLAGNKLFHGEISWNAAYQALDAAISADFIEVSTIS